MLPHPPQVQGLFLARFLWDLALVLSVIVNREFLFISLLLPVSATLSQALIPGAGKSPRSCRNPWDPLQLPQGSLLPSAPPQTTERDQTQVWGVGNAFVFRIHGKPVLAGTFPLKPGMLWKKLYLNLSKVIPVSVGRQCSSCRVLYQYSVLPPGSCSFAVASTCADLIFSHRAVKDLVKISYISGSRSSQFICDMTNISAIRIFPSLSSLNALTYIPNHCLI